MADDRRRYPRIRSLNIVADQGRVFRTLQASPSGPFPNFVDLDGAASTPATQLLCAGETQNGVPLLWALNPDTGALHGASPSTDAWRWWRSFEGAFTTTAAWYEGRRGADELFVVTAGGTLKGFRTNLLPFPRTTEMSYRNQALVDWKEVFDYIGFPAILKPYDGGGWRNVYKVNNIQEFFRALAFNAGITLHVTMHYGHNLHHIAEAVFKAVGRALAQATRLDPRIAGVLPSTKGVL